MNVETGMKKVTTGAVVALALAFMVMLPAGGTTRAQFSEFQLPPGQDSGGSLKFSPGSITG